MERILFRNQHDSRNDQQVYYKRNPGINCQVNDLVMISNCRRTYLFVNYDIDRNESPVFKVISRKVEYGELCLELRVLKVIYPQSLFNSDNDRANMLRAIHEGLAVLKETEVIIRFSIGRTHQIEPVNLKVVLKVNPIETKECVKINGDWEEGIVSRFMLEKRPNQRYQYFISRKPDKGKLDIDGRTGDWRYIGNNQDNEKDSFELTVWDGLGGWATQKVVLQCKQSVPIDEVKILNTSLPVLVDQPLQDYVDVPLVNSSDVNILNIVQNRANPQIELTPSTILSESLSNPIEISGVGDLVSGAAIEISEIPLVDLSPSMILSESLSSPIEVSGVDDLVSGAAVGISCISLVELTSSTILSLNLSDPIEVNGVLDLVPRAMVAINGTPTILLEEPVEITGTINTVNLEQTFYEPELSPQTIQVAASGGGERVLYDVSQASREAFFIHLVNQNASVTVSLFISPTINEDYYYTIGPSAVLDSNQVNYLLVPEQFSRYIGVLVENNTSVTADVEIFVQSQGGPISSVTLI